VCVCVCCVRVCVRVCVCAFVCERANVSDAFAHPGLWLGRV